MIRKTTITLLRIPFSFFLMPVFFFAVSQAGELNYAKTLLSFFIIHFLMYPASNGYNSYMDRDEESIGMLEKPPAPTRQLFWVTLVLDALALALSFLVNRVFALCIAATILASRAYSYRRIRLKKLPVTGFLTVVIFQGAVAYFMIQVGSAGYKPAVPWTGMLASSLLFGGFYPLTQIYQHEQDLRDGVRTISYKLGIGGTFIFSGIMYALAELVMFMHFWRRGSIHEFWIMQLFFIPVIAYFIFWWRKAHQAPQNANFFYAMRMNIIAASCTNTGFILLYFINHVF